LHVAFFRSYLAHAKIGRISLDANRMPGVVAAYTAQHFKNLQPLPAEGPDGLKTVERRPLASGRVRYVGQPIAMLVAESYAVARDALATVEVELEELPAVVDMEHALEPSSPLLYPELGTNAAFRIVSKHGPIRDAFKKADVVVGLKLVNQRLIPAAMEPRAILATFENDCLTVNLSSQSPHLVRENLASVLGLDESQVRVIVQDVGGGFGSKGDIHGEEYAVAEAARRLGRPVKWIEDRTENCLATWQGRGQVQEVELAAKRDGTLLGVRSLILTDMGGVLESVTADVGTSTPDLQTGCYQIPASQSTLIGVYTNTTPTGPYRGAGRPEASYLIERAMDRLARELGRDPADLRRQNFIRKDQFPYTNPGDMTIDSGDYQASLDRLLALADYEGLRRAQGEARRRDRLVGIGLCTYLEVGGGNPADESSARLDPDGGVTVFTGSTPHGQGHQTTWAQIIADQLGIPFDQVRIRYGDTAEPAYAMGTWGSRSAAMSGSAVQVVGGNLKQRIRELAADGLEAAVDDVVVEEGRAFVRGVPTRGFSFKEIAGWAENHGQSDRLQVEARFEADESAEFVYPFGAHLAQVEVDPETGSVQLRRYVAVDDCGVVINPMIVDGQRHGAITQGIAQALFEEAAYDKNGQPLAANLTTYLMPTAADLPNFEMDRTVTPSPNNPLGAKGIGEGGCIGAPPAVVNAVLDALQPLGIKHLDMPLTPQKIWQAIQRADGSPRAQDSH
jgi:carbon-monoxide dehydrogenase large subunit